MWVGCWLTALLMGGLNGALRPAVSGLLWSDLVSFKAWHFHLNTHLLMTLAQRLPPVSFWLCSLLSPLLACFLYPHCTLSLSPVPFMKMCFSFNILFLGSNVPGLCGHRVSPVINPVTVPFTLRIVS